MKRFILILSMLLAVSPVMAKNVKVEALSNFSTANPPSTWELKILEGFVANDGFQVSAGSVVVGKVEDVVSPKRLKRNATFRFVPTTYYNSLTGYSQHIKRDFIGKYSPKSELNAKKIVTNGAISAGNIFVGAFVAPSVGLIEGAIKNEEGNRAKSAVVSAYERTPLSYANKGKDLEFKKGDVFIMNFKLKAEEEAEEAENKPNYTYTIE